MADAACARLAHADGRGYQAGALTADQVQRVEILTLVNKAMRDTAVGSFGRWLITSNAAPIFTGSAPANYLTRIGGPGFEGLLRQVVAWQGP